MTNNSIFETQKNHKKMEEKILIPSASITGDLIQLDEKQTQAVREAADLIYNAGIVLTLSGFYFTGSQTSTTTTTK